MPKAPSQPFEIKSVALTRIKQELNANLIKSIKIFSKITQMLITFNFSVQPPFSLQIEREHIVRR
ncbi:hypothetical protein SAMN05421760_10823 [Neptunomonas antarctica]|uniref:Uncharacterized protein n=1 Tax=Neptunomonas antarctica TaxID=619304 RepID=A0A1N7N4D5_9GAMM|nr:hypothetical protein SAMN05421760_10823 [Neptunomonas antarctica]